MLKEASSISKDTYLNALAASHRQTTMMVDELHQFDEDHVRPVVGEPVLFALLERNLEDLFVPFIDNSEYINIELEWLKNYLETEITQAKIIPVEPKPKDTSTVGILASAVSSFSASPDGSAPKMPGIKVDVAIKCLAASQQSFERAKELCRTMNLGPNLGQIIDLVIEHLGKNYLMVHLREYYFLT